MTEGLDASTQQQARRRPPEAEFDRELELVLGRAAAAHEQQTYHSFLDQVDRCSLQLLGCASEDRKPGTAPVPRWVLMRGDVVGGVRCSSRQSLRMGPWMQLFRSRSQPTEACLQNR
jgi:hypothetical protein